MGKIDKEKLLKEIRSLGYYEETQVIKIIKNFPEEPEIDFDVLHKEYSGSVKFHSIPSAWGFRDFLKSKNLTAPKPVEIPMNRTWTLKKHVGEIFHDFGNSPYPFTSDPPENLKKYYDQHEEPDYSKIPKGSIVEIECLGDKFYRTFVKFEHENIFTKDGEEIEQWSPTVIIRIVELAKE